MLAFASGFLVFAYFAIGLFQLLIFLGAPLKQYAFAAQRLSPKNYKILSAAAGLGMLGISGHYVAQLGILKPVLGDDLNALANIGFAGFALFTAVFIGLLGNKKERGFLLPITAIIFLAALVVAL
jgi:hypothetical protein